MANGSVMAGRARSVAFVAPLSATGTDLTPRAHLKLGFCVGGRSFIPGALTRQRHDGTPRRDQSVPSVRREEGLRAATLAALGDHRLHRAGVRRRGGAHPAAAAAHILHAPGHHRSSDSSRGGELPGAPRSRVSMLAPESVVRHLREVHPAVASSVCRDAPGR